MDDEPKMVERVMIGRHEGQVVKWGNRFFAQVKCLNASKTHDEAFKTCMDMLEAVAEPDEFEKARGRVKEQIALRCRLNQQD